MQWDRKELWNNTLTFFIRNLSICKKSAFLSKEDKPDRKKEIREIICKLKKLSFRLLITIQSPQRILNLLLVTKTKK